MRILLSIAILSLPIAAQDLRFRLPLSGAVYNAPDHSVRLVLGVPGSAYLSEPVLDGLDAASIAPDGKRALVIKDGQLWVARDLDAGAPALDAAGSLPACADLVAWSGDSTAAAVYCGTSGTLRRLDGLDSAAGREPADVDVAALGGDLRGMAVAGRAVVAAFASGGLWRLRATGPPRLLASLPSPSILAYSAERDSAFAIDRESCQIWEIRGVSGEPESGVFASLSEPGCDPSGLALADRGNTLLVADGAARKVRAFDLRGRSAPGEIALDFAPTALEPLIPGSVFRLNSATTADEPLNLLNATQRTAFFLPAGRRQ